MKNFKSLYGFGERRLKIRDVCMDFEPYFKVHNLFAVHHKSIILQGSYGSWKTWKVLEFYYGIFQDWKVLEKGHWSWKVLEIC